MALALTGERQIARTLDQIAPDHRARYEWAAEHIKVLLGRPATILDAACGVGYGSYILAEAGHTVLGVDNNAEAIAQSIEVYNHPNIIDYVEADVINGALPEEFTPDVVVSFETIEHVQRDAALIKRFSMTAPLLIASVPNEITNPFTKEQYPFHERHYSPMDLEDLMYDNGYKRISEWWTQTDKWTGTMEQGEHGRTLIIVANT